MEDKKIYDISDILIYMWNRRKMLILVTLSGALISVIISLLLPVKYRAETFLFPTTALAPSTMSNHINQETDPLKFGNESDLERTIQMLRSEVISDKIIEKYDLISHYGIKENDKYKRTKANTKFRSNVSFAKTSYQGITISVLDENPEKAADIANDISSLLDSLVMNMQLQRAGETYNVALKTYETELKYLNMLEDSLDQYRQLGIIYFEKEADRWTEAYAKSLGKNTLTPGARKEFEAKFDLLKEHGKAAYSLQKRVELVSGNVSQFHLRLAQMEQNMKQPMSRKYIISPAQAPDKKHSPARSIIVIFSTIGFFIFAVAASLIFDYVNELRKKIKSE
jgi:uncharacterized protein involved in exopolysaccharide biosynthesis